MRVTLNQNELFEAISSYMSDKFNLDNTAKIEISFTAGRGPKGYTADVDITYPVSANAAKITARDADATDAAEPAETAAATSGDTQATQATPEAAAGGAVPVDNLFTT